MMEFPFTETSYQTAPRIEYDPLLLERATDLFRRIGLRVDAGRMKEHKGSFSVIARSSEATAAKIIIYEAGKGKLNGPDPCLTDGVYVLLRLPTRATGRSIAVAPMHHERFAYFRLHDCQDLEEMADFVACCAGAQ